MNCNSNHSHNQNISLSDIMHEATCPACGYHVAITFYSGGNMPLTTQAWPATSTEAQEMARLPHDFVRCVDCGHVFNQEFRYENVPYQEKPNLMYNRGKTWESHIERVKELLLAQLPENPTVVEIGCGDGTLLCSLAESRPNGKFYGFDPNALIETGGGLIEAKAMYFDPAVHLSELKPDLIISRHVLEHLMNPLGFVQQVAFASSWENHQTQLYIEVPCIDRVFQINRTIDFYYEHRSHFTSTSLSRLLERCASQVDFIETGYNSEVVMGLASFGNQPEAVQLANEAISFSQGAINAKRQVKSQLVDLQAKGKSIAIWGGTGKAASFINQFNLTPHDFSLVVDSDAAKVGTCVPGMGQEIVFRDEILHNPVDVILIATQWRAKDIAMEIESAGIQADSILVEWNGELIEYRDNRELFETENRHNSTASESVAETNSVPVKQPYFIKAVQSPTQKTKESR